MPRVTRNLPSAPVHFPWRIAIAVFSLTVAVYIPSMFNRFIWDDPQYVVDNSLLKSADGLWQIWTDPWATPQYYPMVHSTFWFEARMWGTQNAAGFHVDNILLHALAAVLLWRALISISAPLPLLAAAIFAVHPVMVESVTWVTERKNVLSIVFYLLAFHAYRRSGGIDQTPMHRKWYFPALGFFLLALLSKTVTCSLPAAILLLIWWKRGKITWANVKPLIPMFIIGLALSSFTGHLERTHVGARGPDFDWSLLDRCLIAGHAIWFYALKLAWPHPLIFMYPRWDLHDPVGFIYPVVVMLAVIGLWIARRWIGRGPLAATLFFIGTLVPALGFVNVYPMRYSFVADHFQYLASIGFIALFCGMLARILPSPVARSTIVVSVLILSPLIYLTIRQQPIYKDQRTLWENTIAQNETCWMAHVNLAGVYGRAKQMDAAIAQSQRALELAPNEADTQYDMGVALAERKQWQGAADRFRKAIECDAECSQAWSYLARVLWEHFDSAEAKAQALGAARKALLINPDLADAHYVLARVAEYRGDLPGAISEYTRTLAINPDDYHTHYNLGTCLLQTGHPSEAAGEFEKVLVHDSNDALALTNLGLANLMVGRREQAIDYFRRALAINPNLEPAKAGLKQAGVR